MAVCCKGGINSTCRKYGCVNTGNSCWEAFLDDQENPLYYLHFNFEVIFFSFWLKHCKPNKVAVDLEDNTESYVSGGKMQFPCESETLKNE